MKTTLNRIKQLNCLPFESFEKLLRCCNKLAPDDAPLHMVNVRDALGFEGALLCLAAVDGFEREIRLYAVSCVSKVAHFMEDPRNLIMLDVAERYAKGEATGIELNTAWGNASHSQDGPAGTAAWSCGFYGIKSALRNVVAAVMQAHSNQPTTTATEVMRLHESLQSEFLTLILLDEEHAKIGIRK